VTGVQTCALPIYTLFIHRRVRGEPPIQTQVKMEEIEFMAEGILSQWTEPEPTALRLQELGVLAQEDAATASAAITDLWEFANAKSMDQIDALTMGILESMPRSLS
jgi:hypothetical protein